MPLKARSIPSGPHEATHACSTWTSRTTWTASSEVLNAGVRNVGYPYQEKAKQQHKVAVVNDAKLAFAGKRSGYAYSAKKNNTARILLQARYDAPKNVRPEVSEFVFRVTNDKGVDLDSFPIWPAPGGINLLATGTAASGTYDVSVKSGTGLKEGEIKGLSQS